MAKNRAVLFANGEDPQKAELTLYPEDFLIAIDGGLRYLTKRKILPDLLIGDLDSVEPSELESCQKQGVELLKFPPMKNLTDLELGLDEALRRGFREIVIAYGLGGRIDHSLGNLALLSKPQAQACHLAFEDGEVRIFMLSDANPEESFAAEPGETLSLLPWQGEVRGIRTSGLLYPLKGESLLAWETRGISNEVIEKNVSLCITNGSLLVIHYPNPIPKRGV